MAKINYNQVDFIGGVRGIMDADGQPNVYRSSILLDMTQANGTVITLLTNTPFKYAKVNLIMHAVQLAAVTADPSYNVGFNSPSWNNLWQINGVGSSTTSEDSQNAPASGSNTIVPAGSTISLIIGTKAIATSWKGRLYLEFQPLFD